jgi:DNA-directed RNA polymerase beta subunit
MPKKKDHTFLAEELLVPMANHCDTVRLNMFTSHLPQIVSLVEPETPRVYTGFEKQVGSFSSSVRKLDGDHEFLCTVEKNPLARTHFLVDEASKRFIAIEVNAAVSVSEGFGYLVSDEISKAMPEPGDVVPDESVISRGSNHDENGNYSLGTNMRVAYMAFLGMTYEDAIVVSQSAAKKLRAVTIEKIRVSLNQNDVLLNIYGAGKDYKAFPPIGEKTVNGVLCSSRRIGFKTIFNDFPNDKLSIIDHDNDRLVYGRGTLIDVDVYSNAPEDEGKIPDFLRQVNRIKRGNSFYFSEIKRVHEELLARGLKPHGDTSFIYRKACEFLDERSFAIDDRTFENIEVDFTLMREEPLEIGSKITGRYGNKGTISAILPDELMPVGPDGKPLEAILNVFGVLNRMNWSQLNEVLVNRIGDTVAAGMKTLMRDDGDVEGAVNHYFKFITALGDETQAETVKKYLEELSEDELEEFINDVIDGGMRIRVQPFFHSVTPEALSGAIHLFGVEPEMFSVNINGIKVNIERPLVASDIYLYRLKHDADTKFSARSAGSLTLSGVPSKSDSAHKDGTEPYSNTAVRLGEMELSNLLALNDTTELKRFISLYSTSKRGRAALIGRLMGFSGDGNPFSIERVDPAEEKSQPRLAFDSYLKAVGLELLEVED